MGILKTLFLSDKPAASAEPEVIDSSAFDAANAAIDRAVAERQAEAAAVERRVSEPNRRKGLPDTRSPGSPERRNSPQPNFGRRRTPE